MEQDNSHIVLIEPLIWQDIQGVEAPPSAPIMCTFFSDKAKLLFVTYMGGQTYIGKLSQDLCKVETHFCLDLQK